jgi:hypothetical protein
LQIAFGQGITAELERSQTRSLQRGLIVRICP